MVRSVSRASRLLVAGGPTIVHAQAAAPPVTVPRPTAVRRVIDSLAAEFAMSNKVPGTAVRIGSVTK